MSNEVEAMKQALEKIANVNAMDYEYQRWAREALDIATDYEYERWAREALVNAEKQEPDVSTKLKFDCEFMDGTTADFTVYGSERDIKRLEARIKFWRNLEQRQPLTDEQMLDQLSRIDEHAVRLPRGLRDFARAIEVAHGIKEKTHDT